MNTDLQSVEGFLWFLMPPSKQLRFRLLHHFRPADCFRALRYRCATRRRRLTNFSSHSETAISLHEALVLPPELAGKPCGQRALESAGTVICIDGSSPGGGGIQGRGVARIRFQKAFAISEEAGFALLSRPWMRLW